MFVIVSLLSSENDWKTNRTAVLCALETFDVYQKERRVDSVKYIQQKSVASSDLLEPDPAKARQTSAAAEVMWHANSSRQCWLQIQRSRSHL